FTLVEAEDRLKYRCRIRIVRLMVNKGIVDAMTNRSFKGLVQNPAPAQAVEFPQLGFDIRYIRTRPLLHNRRIKTAKLCHMKKRPRTLNHDRFRRSRQLVLQDGPQV